MRVSNNMNYDQVKGNIGKNRVEMNDLQNQASTMKRITKPSDDPVGTSRMLGVRTDQVGTTQFFKNIDVAKNFMGYTEVALGEASDVIARAKELAIGQASDASTNAAARMAVSTEIEQLLKDMVHIGNRKVGERFIFGGYKTTHSPFDNEGNYKGDQGGIKIEVSKGVFTTINLPGDQVFIGKNSRLAQIPTERRGSTKPNYPPVPADKEQEDNIEVRGPASQKDEKTDKTDTTNKAEAKQPDTEFAREAKRKDGLDANETIVNPKENAEGENVFSVLKALSAGLRSNDTVAIQETLERLDTAHEQVVILRSQIGSRMSSLENTNLGLGKTKTEDATLLSSIEDADAFAVFTDITKNENTLKATLQTSGKILQPSLLDFLR
jgi:flagellar hook-associated protein 3 FlgL